MLHNFVKYSPIIFFWWKINSFPVILYMKRLIFVILCRSFFYFLIIWCDCSGILKAFIIFWYNILFLFHFLSSQENLYMIHHDSYLFYDIYNTITKHNQRQTRYLSKLFWYLFFSESKRSFTTSSASSFIMISMLSLFEWITRSSSLSMEEIKLFGIVNWIFHTSDFFRLMV